MVTVLIDSNECTIPDSVKDLDSFVEWKHSDEFPEFGRYWWIQGKVWADYDMEEVFSHNLVKTEFASVLRMLVKKSKIGKFFADGVLIKNDEADLSGEPDGSFVSNASIQSGRVEFVQRKKGRCTIIEGSPDMVLEIISRSSVRKDSVVLRQAYWLAGVSEYWMVDARTPDVTFHIFRRTSRGFQAVRSNEGWIKSAVFGNSFKLVRSDDELLLPEFSLETR